MGVPVQVHRRRAAPHRDHTGHGVCRGLSGVLSVFWPAADAWIISHVPAWERLAPAIAQVREWLGIHQPEPDPWWRFW